MYNKNDFAKLGHVYGGMLNDMKRKLVSEGKTGEIGEAPLIKGGPQETAGYVPAKIDRKKMSKKELDDNLYNIKGLSQPDDLEEDEEMPAKPKKKVVKGGKNKSKKETSKQSGKSGKIVSESINNFMRSKSIFDKLYENVTGQFGNSPSMDSGIDETEELDALGIEGEGDEMGNEGDEVTFTLDRATAQKLHDVLMGVLGGEEEDLGDEGDFEMGGEDEGGDDLGGFNDEDEEEMGHAVASPKQPDMGKNNKVGNLKVKSGGASSAYTNKVGDDGDHGHALVNAKQPDMGKNNKVGKLKTGTSLFEQ